MGHYIGNPADSNPHPNHGRSVRPRDARVCARDSPGHPTFSASRRKGTRPLTFLRRPRSIHFPAPGFSRPRWMIIHPDSHAPPQTTEPVAHTRYERTNSFAIGWRVTMARNEPRRSWDFGLSGGSGMAVKLLRLAYSHLRRRCGGWDLNPRTPKGRDAPSEAGPDLESRTVDQASLPPRRWRSAGFR